MKITKDHGNTFEHLTVTGENHPSVQHCRVMESSGNVFEPARASLPDYSELLRTLHEKAIVTYHGWLFKEAAAAIIALQAELERGKARPIEEAPRDGTWVLLTGGSIEYGWDGDTQPPFVVGQWVGKRSTNGVNQERWQFAWYDSGYYGEYETPTHFKPLSALGTPT